MKPIVLAFFLLSTHILYPQQAYDPKRTYDLAVLQEDFTVLRNILEEAHPGLERYTDKKTLDTFFDACFARINRPMTEIDFFKIINRALMFIKDEHTFSLPSSDYWKNEIGQTVYSGSASRSTARFFPFFIKIINKRLFIENNLSNDISFSDGTEIISLNGKTGSQVIDLLLPTVHTNGFVETFRYRNLEQFSLQQTYNRFIVHYAIFIGQPDSFNLVVQKPGERSLSFKSVTALTSTDIFNNYWRRYSAINDSKKSKENPLEFKLLKEKIAYLRLSDFHTDAWRKYNLSFSTEYRNDFSFIKDRNIRHLIIDLRGNEGGNLAIGIELLKYLAKTTYQPYLYHELKNYKFPAFKRYMVDSTALDRFHDSLFIKTDRNTFRNNSQIRTEVWSRPMQPVSDPYSGKLYVLINGATGSAASILATLIRVNRRDAIFIGEESGGDMEGPISGDGLDIALPNTRIRISVPYIRRAVNLNGYPNVKGRGIIPDYTITTGIADFVRKEDTALKFVLKLIK